MKISFSARLSEKHQEDLKLRFPKGNFSYFENIYEAIEVRGQETEVLVTYGEDLTPEMIDQLPNLKWIQLISAGVERMPLKTLADKGILVTNARGIHGTPMAEYTLGVMLEHVRKFSTFYKLQEQGEWNRDPRLEELADKTVGIIGAGAIGKQIARRAKAFDMNVWGMNSDGRSLENFDQMFTRDHVGKLLSESDFVVLILPLTPETERFMTEAEFRQMKSSAVFINISRGKTIDESALVQALREKWIAMAYLDVFEVEPLPADHPFWTLDNCKITPHISARSPHYMTRALDIFKENLELYQQGAVDGYQNVIRAERGY